MIMQIIDAVFGTMFIAGLTITGFTLLCTAIIFCFAEPKVERPRALKALYTVAIPFMIVTVISGVITYSIHFAGFVSP